LFHFTIHYPRPRSERHHRRGGRLEPSWGRVRPAPSKISPERLLFTRISWSLGGCCNQGKIVAKILSTYTNTHSPPLSHSLYLSQTRIQTQTDRHRCRWTNLLSLTAAILTVRWTSLLSLYLMRFGSVDKPIFTHL
jgi:hypothetical protein